MDWAFASRSSATLSLVDANVSGVGVDLQLGRAIADGSRGVGGTVGFLVPQGAEVGGDVALARGGIDLESGVGRQYDSDVAVLAGQHHLADGQLAGRMDLNIAIRVFHLQVAGHAFQMNVFGPGNEAHRSADVGGPQRVAGDFQVARNRCQRNVGTRRLELHRPGDLAEADVIEEVAVQLHRTLNVLQRHVVNAAVDRQIAGHVAGAD